MANERNETLITILGVENLYTKIILNFTWCYQILMFSKFSQQ